MDPWQERRPGESAADAARRLARTAWASTWPHVRDRIDERLEGAAPGGALTRPADRRLARQLARDAEQARRAQLRAQREHELAVARRERVLRRSRRAIPRWSVVSGGAAVATIPVDGGVSVTLLSLLAGGGAARVAVAARRLWKPPAVPAPPPVAPAGPPPPHPRSAAFPAIRRLEQARGALQSLVPLCSPAAREAAEEAWHAAAEADTALRWQAARLAAAEPHSGADPALLAALEAGVTAQEGLVQAVADLVAACAHPHDADRLQDVTDRLHGLAAGLREVG